MVECSYCTKGMLTPYKYIGRLVDSTIDRYIRKRDDVSMHKLLQYSKLDPYIRDYIATCCYDLIYVMYNTESNNDSTYFAVRNFLKVMNSRSSTNLLQCSYCNKYACDFHINVGGFIFPKCNCGKKMTMCGWCQETIQYVTCSECMYSFDSNVDPIMYHVKDEIVYNCTRCFDEIYNVNSCSNCNYHILCDLCFEECSVCAKCSVGNDYVYLTDLHSCNPTF